MKATFGLLILVLASGCLGLQQDKPEFDFGSIVDTFRGIFEAWKANNEKVEELLKCVGNVGDIETQLWKIIEILKNATVDDPRQMMQLIAKIIQIAQEGFNDVKQCYHSTSELLTILRRIFSLGFIELITKVLGNIRLNGPQIWSDLSGMYIALTKGNFYKFGYFAGELTDLLILKLVPPV